MSHARSSLPARGDRTATPRQSHGRLTICTTVLLTTQHSCCILGPGPMTSQEFKRWLQRQGCTFDPGHGGHLIVRLGSRFSVLPMHGKQKELGTRLVGRTNKDPGPKERSGPRENGGEPPDAISL